MSLLPGAGRAIVHPDKIAYLTNAAHPENRGKAGFFAMFGFSPSDLKTIADALQEHARSRSITSQTTTPFDRKIVLDCDIRTPDGRNPCIRTIWLLLPVGAPWLVTAYPRR